MEILTNVLHNLAVALLTQAGTNAVQWLVGKLKQDDPERKAEEIQHLLQNLGCVTEGTIRKLVQSAAQGKGRIPRERQEEVIALLVNLTRGARFLTTQGAPRSTYLRCESLLDQLLGNLQPQRKYGEKVAIGKDWVLERYLGMGTFGEVWMARSQFTKLPPRAFKFFTRPDAQEWIRREKDGFSAVIDRLGHHPHLITFHDVAIENQQRPYLELEYVGGGSLEDWIVEDASRRPMLDKQTIIRGVVRGLAKAHEQQIYHRDLKPANILLTEPPDVQAKIADFGLATIGAENPLAATANASEAIQVGTSMYLPPEAQQVFIQRPPAQDDVFAVGVIWYQLVVERLERPPYDFADELRKYGQDSHTIRLISRCLAHPGRRFKDATELAEELDDTALPVWKVPAGFYDVQYLVREYLSTAPK